MSKRLLYSNIVIFCCFISMMGVQAGIASMQQEESSSKDYRPKKLSVLSKAEVIARSMPDRNAKVMMLAIIGKERAEVGDRQNAQKLFEEVETILEDRSLDRTAAHILIAEGYLLINRLDEAIRIAEAFDHSDETLADLAEELIYRGQLSDAGEVCAKIQTALVYRPLGMLAYAYYKQGKQKESERLIKQVSGQSESACIFYRDTFAAQARWELESGRKQQAKTLLDIAAYWQACYEKLQEKDYHKEGEIKRWAKQQARAGDIKGTIATLSRLPPPEMVHEQYLEADSSWLDYIQHSIGLAGLVEPQMIVDYLNSSFGKIRLPEQAIVEGLVLAAREAGRLKKTKDEQFLWKAAYRAIKDRDQHLLVTLGLVHAQMSLIENKSLHAAKSKEYFNHADEQFKEEWSKTKAFDTEINPCKYVDYLVEAHAPTQAYAFIKEYFPHACSHDVFKQRQSMNLPRILIGRFQVTHTVGNLIHTNQEYVQKMMELAEEVQDPAVRVQLYIGIAWGLQPLPPLPQGRYYRDSFMISD